MSQHFQERLLKDVSVISSSRKSVTTTHVFSKGNRVYPLCTINDGDGGEIVILVQSDAPTG